MSCCDNDEVLGRNGIIRKLDAGKAEIGLINDWNQRVMIREVGSLLEQQVRNLERRGFAKIVDILFVSHAQQQNPCSPNRLADTIQQLAYPLDHVVRHGVVDLSGKLNETGGEVVLLRLPRQIERVERNAMATESRPGIEGHVAKRLSFGRLDDLPDVDPHPFTEQGQLVDHRDIDDTEDVLQQLGHLSDTRRGNTENTAIEHRFVQPRGSLGAGWRDAANDFGCVLRFVLKVPGIDAFGRERKMDIGPDRESSHFDKGLNDLLSGTRIRRAFQHNQLSGVKMRRRLPHDMVDVGGVRLLVLVERGGNADQHDVDIGHSIEFGGRAKASVSNHVAQFVRYDVADVVLRAVNHLYTLRVSLDPDNREPGPRHLNRQWQTNISKSNDRDLCIAFRNLL